MNYFKKRRDNLFELMLDNSILISFSRYLNKEPIYNDRYDVLRNTYCITGVIDYGHIVVLIKDKEKGTICEKWIWTELQEVEDKEGNKKKVEVDRKVPIVIS